MKECTETFILIVCVCFYRSSLRSDKLRGLQRLFQAFDPQAAGLHVSRRQGLRSDQTPPQSLPVLPPTEMPLDGHAQ